MQVGTLIGPEVHRATVCLSVAQGTRGGEVRHLGDGAAAPRSCRQAGWEAGGRRGAVMPAKRHRAGDLTAQQIVLRECIDAVADAGARVARLTGQIAALLPGRSLVPVVDAVRAMRGVGVIVAGTVGAGVGDFRRFDTRGQPMAWLGLTPPEHSGGASVRRGGITRAGSGLARRALTGGARSYRMQARVSPKLLSQDVPAFPPSGRARKGQGGGHHSHRARDGRLHLGDRPHHQACDGLRGPRTTAPDPSRCTGLGAQHGGEPPSPVMGRHSRCPIPGPRQPRDETAVMRDPTRAGGLAQPSCRFRLLPCASPSRGPRPRRVRCHETGA